MKVLVTGATGFVGRWLIPELETAGHDAVAAPGSASLDVTDERAVARLIAGVRPDAVAHLAGVSYGPDASRDPNHAFAVNVGGTVCLLRAIVALGRPVPTLVVGSSEVYAPPAPEDLPLRESAALGPTTLYGLSKLAQEAVALEVAERDGLPLVVTRSFNHTGPGQRDEFVVPALARRLLAARADGGAVQVGNLDVRRDIGDVRDVVRAYRLLLEALVAGGLPDRLVVNVGTGRSVSIRHVLDTLAVRAGISPEVLVDPSLVRAGEAAEIRGDVSLLEKLVGWRPEVTLERTLADVLDHEAGRSMT